MCFLLLQVIRTLDPKQNQGSAPEIQALKNQLQERERMFHSLEVISYEILCTFKPNSALLKISRFHLE